MCAAVGYSVQYREALEIQVPLYSAISKGFNTQMCVGDVFKIPHIHDSVYIRKYSEMEEFCFMNFADAE